MEHFFDTDNVTVATVAAALILMRPLPQSSTLERRLEDFKKAYRAVEELAKENRELQVGPSPIQ